MEELTPVTLGFMQVGLDQQTSTKYKSKLWFGLDKQLSTLVLKFNFIFSISSGCGADGMLIPNLHKALLVVRHLTPKISLTVKMPGRVKDKLDYLSGLNEKDFPYLIADILKLHLHHTDVKVVDGTGDGKRDIFSISEKGAKTITQCKFHYDFDKTSGTSETDEIVIALNKFDYSNGIFCTSGKLSPQSRREYLDNYPKFNLLWFEGHEIVDIVLENSILRKIWFEGEKIHLLNNKISIPFIIRQLPEDIDFKLIKPIEINLSDETEVSINPNSLYNQTQFRPFNGLDIRNSSIHFGNVFAFDAILTGNVHFNTIERLKDEVLQTLQNSFPELEKSYLAIRFGIPHFLEEEGRHKNYKIEKFNLPLNSETYILRNGVIMTEYDFLIDVNESWKQPDRIHMSQLDNLCFYNKVHDLALFIYYTCAAREDLHPHVIRQIEVEKIIWKKSLFLLGEKGIARHFKELPPDKVYMFGPNAEIACWMHPYPFMYSLDLNQFEDSLYHEEFEKNKKELSLRCSLLNLEQIDWIKASKVAALNNDDPFPNNPQTSYRIVDIFEDFENIPSPIKPQNRQLIFECVWFVSTLSDISFDERIDKFRNELDVLNQNEKLKFTIDNETNEPIYLRCTYTPEFVSYISSSENLDILTDEVSTTFNNVERVLLNSFPKTIRTTKAYWLSELGIFLDITS